jgi:hypothetical protein
MAFYAWTQDVPITAEMYDEITAGMAPTPGAVVHLALQTETGLRYIDVWESEEACDKAFETVVHPAVRPVLQKHGVNPPGEPPRTPITVLEVRFPDGSFVRP